MDKSFEKWRLKGLLISILAFIGFSIWLGILFLPPGPEDYLSWIMAVGWLVAFQITSILCIIIFAFPKSFISFVEKYQKKIERGESGWFTSMVKKKQEELERESKIKERRLD